MIIENTLLHTLKTTITCIQPEQLSIRNWNFSNNEYEYEFHGIMVL